MAISGSILARLAGALYLVLAISGGFSQLVARSGAWVAGDAAATGYLVAEVFFGLWLLPLGYAVYRSGYFPAWIGIALMVGCFGYLAAFTATVVSPGFESGASVYLALPAAFAELAFLLWLLVKGADVPAREGRAAEAVAVPA